MHVLYKAACIGLEACGCLERVDVRGNALTSLGGPAGGPGPLAALTALTALDAGANRLAAFPGGGRPAARAAGAPEPGPQPVPSSIFKPQPLTPNP